MTTVETPAEVSIDSPNRTARRNFITLWAVFALIATVVVWALVSRQAFVRATPTAFDNYWVNLYVQLAVVIGLLVWLFRGRLLLALTILALLGVLAIAATAGGAGVALLVLLWLLVLAWRLGVEILTALARDADISGAERNALGIVTGLGAMTVVVFIIAALGLLHSRVLVSVLAALTVAAAYRSRFEFSLSRVRTLGSRISNAKSFKLPAFVLACCLVSLCAALVWALAPETGYDPLNYQLGVPQVYVREHALVELPYTFWSYLLGSTGMLYAMALSLTGQPLPQLIHLAS